MSGNAQPRLAAASGQLVVKFQVQVADPWDPPGCMGPTAPFVGFVLEPLMPLLALATSAPGSAHSKASSEIGPGVWATSLMVTFCVPETPPFERSWA